MPAPPVRQTRLTIELLEARETPAAGPWATATFDLAVPGAVPGGWTGWGSDGDAGWRVAEAPAMSGRSFASAGGSARAGRAWLGAIQPANLTATAAILANSLIPAQVFVRGRGLDSARPTYYAASLIRGLDVQMLRVQDGNITELASLKSASYLSGVWVDLSITTKADRLQVRVRRRDTGEWLNHFGTWQSTPAAALDARDPAISTPGHVGLMRAASHAGNVYVDDVRVGPADGDLRAPATTATVGALEQPLRASTVAGLVRLGASVRDANRMDRVEFFVDG